MFQAALHTAACPVAHAAHAVAIPTLSSTCALSTTTIRQSSDPHHIDAANHMKLLYIWNTMVSLPTIAKMVCPDCRLSEFTNMQGPFNHTRLEHHLEYGGHDECMQACAVVVEKREEVGESEWVLKNGIELHR